MATVGDRDQLRTRVLSALYEATDGIPQTRDVDYRSLATAVEATDLDLTNAVEWLVDHQRAEWTALGGSLGITRQGGDQVEEWVRTGERPTPARANVDLVLRLTMEEQQDVEAFLGDLARARDAGEVRPDDPDDEVALDAEVEAVTSALRSPKPNKGVVSWGLRGIKVLVGDARQGAIGVAVGLLLVPCRRLGCRAGLTSQWTRTIVVAIGDRGQNLPIRRYGAAASPDGRCQTRSVSECRTCELVKRRDEGGAPSWDRIRRTRRTFRCPPPKGEEQAARRIKLVTQSYQA